MIEKLSRVEFVRKLDEATRQIEDLQKAYDNTKEPPKELSRVVQHLIPVLKECNESLQDKAIAPGPDLNKSIDKFLSTFNAFPFLRLHPDKTTQEKVGLIQASLFRNLMEEFKMFEKNLKELRIGVKVEGADRSKEY